jgi:hypothetical protein
VAFSSPHHDACRQADLRHQNTAQRHHINRTEPGTSQALRRRDHGHVRSRNADFTRPRGACSALPALSPGRWGFGQLEGINRRWKSTISQGVCADGDPQQARQLTSIGAVIEARRGRLIYSNLSSSGRWPKALSTTRGWTGPVTPAD